MSSVTEFDAKGNGTTVGGSALLPLSLSDREATAFLTSGEVTSEEFCAWLAAKTKAANGRSGWHPTPPRLPDMHPRRSLRAPTCSSTSVDWFQPRGGPRPGLCHLQGPLLRE